MTVAHITEQGVKNDDGTPKVQDQYFQSNDELVRFLTSKPNGTKFLVEYVKPETLELNLDIIPAPQPPA